ncbi:MAG: AAA family ATPase [Pseudonocardiaceae bacterium]
MPGYILTGAPGAGKTAILRLLEVKEHVVVVEEAAELTTRHDARELLYDESVTQRAVHA